MSVLKSILHHWNSTSKAYDTLHPETEVGQITDFGKGLLNQLAATTAQSVISALQTGSWFGQLLKLVLNASGVKYSIDTNGYVCLGSFFGGLIIQWGKISFEKSKTSMSVSYPIAVSNSLTVWAFDYGPACESVAANLESSTVFTMYRLSGGTSNYRYVALGIA